MIETIMMMIGLKSNFFTYCELLLLIVYDIIRLQLGLLDYLITISLIDKLFS